MARKESLSRMHAKLVARRDALRKALAGDIDSLRALSGEEVGDSVDAAMDTASEEINAAIIEIESRELEQIEHALEQFARGSYGRCEFCQGKIAEARINALPYVTTCIDCAREQERFGSSRRVSGDDMRWAKLYDREVRESDAEVKLSDFEVDMSEMGR